MNPEGVLAVEHVLHLFERFPDGDFGVPGPLAHAIEQFYGKGYEELLTASLRRKPTPMTIWLANRIVNADDGNSGKFLSLLQELSNRSDLDASARQELTFFLSQPR